MGAFYIIVCAVFGILGIILFFKVWGMCDNVKAIKDRLDSVLPTENEIKHKELAKAAEEKETKTLGEFSVGMTVVYPPVNRIMIVKKIHDDGKIECVSYRKDGKEETQGLYKPSQIRPISQETEG